MAILPGKIRARINAVGGITASFIYYFGAVDPGRVQARRDAWAVGILVGIALYILFLTVFEIDLRTKARLLRDGFPVCGKIVSKRTIRGKSTTYELTYDYPFPAGTFSFRGRHTISVPKAAFDAFSSGMPLSVLVDHNRPTHSAPYLLLTQVEIEGAAPRALPRT